MWAGEDLFPFCRLLFCLTVLFALQKLFSFRESHLFIVALNICVTGVILGKWIPIPMHSRLHPTFSSVRFSVARFMLRSLIQFDLSFVYGDRYGSICILLYDSIQLCQRHLLKMPVSYNKCPEACLYRSRQVDNKD